MTSRCSRSALTALWLLLAAVSVSGRHFSIQYGPVPLRQMPEQSRSYLAEPIFDVERLRDIAPYESDNDERLSFFRTNQLQKPRKRYLGVEIPDEIAGDGGGGGGGGYIGRLKQQMQNSGK